MIDIDYYKRLNGDFYRRAGVISNSDRLVAMGLEPQNAIGGFWSKDAVRLVEFCRQNPEYHIISVVDSKLIVNRYVHGKRQYHLADGDNDPTLELAFPPEIIDHLNAELALFIRGTKLKL